MDGCYCIALFYPPSTHTYTLACVHRCSGSLVSWNIVNLPPFDLCQKFMKTLPSTEFSSNKTSFLLCIWEWFSSVYSFKAKHRLSLSIPQMLCHQNRLRKPSFGDISWLPHISNVLLCSEVWNWIKWKFWFSAWTKINNSFQNGIIRWIEWKVNRWQQCVFWMAFDNHPKSVHLTFLVARFCALNTNTRAQFQCWLVDNNMCYWILFTV